MRKKIELMFFLTLSCVVVPALLVVFLSCGSSVSGHGYKDPEIEVGSIAGEWEHTGGKSVNVTINGTTVRIPEGKEDKFNKVTLRYYQDRNGNGDYDPETDKELWALEKTSADGVDNFQFGSASFAIGDVTDGNVRYEVTASTTGGQTLHAEGACNLNR